MDTTHAAAATIKAFDRSKLNTCSLNRKVVQTTVMNTAGISVMTYGFFWRTR